ncbi:EboA domain-containing protein [Streptomyces sp. NRRL S-1868]|uniref:EboA domain-containing protein n=1 Tax=Streptomyces sp. NRRL S-1868 TaxID=1463892 RepID=UPI0007C6926C|nr:EboA domain-containing protein [Streptomyces sp. NRRL S-1868]
MLTPLASLRTGLELRLGADARAWLHLALTEAADAPRYAGRHGLPPWERHFAAAGRHCRDTSARPGDAPHGTPHGTVPEAADAARILLLHAAGPDTEALARLYAHGSADERRAVLLALPHLDPQPSADGARALVEDALRANDTRLIAAALGPWSARHLDAHQWRHALLKCLFTGVPLSAVAGLEERAAGDGELARMLEDYARERTAASRPVPADLHRALRAARRPRAAGPAPGPTAEGTAAEGPAAEAPAARPSEQTWEG